MPASAMICKNSLFSPSHLSSSSSSCMSSFLLSNEVDATPSSSHSSGKPKNNYSWFLCLSLCPTACYINCPLAWQFGFLNMSLNLSHLFIVSITVLAEVQSILLLHPLQHSLNYLLSLLLLLGCQLCSLPLPGCPI